MLMLSLCCMVCSRGEGADPPPSSPELQQTSPPTSASSPFHLPDATHIAIADFLIEGNGVSPRDGAELAQILKEMLDEYIHVVLPADTEPVVIPPESLEIERVRRPVGGYDEGRTLGEAIGADVVLWGTGHCEMPHGQLLLEASGPASRAVAGTLKARGFEKVTLKASKGGTTVGGDAELASGMPMYSVCAYAALTGWNFQGRGKTGEVQTMAELRDLPLGRFAAGDPGAVLDLILGLHFNRRYDPKTADRFYRSVRPALAKRPDLIELGLWLAKTDQDLGNTRDALQQYERILATCKVTRSTRLETGTLNNIGGVHSALGENQEALKYYEQALPLSRAVGDRSGEATTLGNIGRVHSALGEKQEALKYYEQALPLFRAVGDRSGEAPTLNNIGLVHDDLGEKQEALKYYEQALPLFRAEREAWGLSNTLNNLGRLEIQQGLKREGREHLLGSAQIGCTAGRPECAALISDWYSSAATSGMPPKSFDLDQVDGWLIQRPAADPAHPLMLALRTRLLQTSIPSLGGVAVLRLIEGGNASRAGVLPGDLIVQYDHLPLGPSHALPDLVKATTTRPDVELVLLRDKERITLHVPGGLLGIEIRALP